jgi:hypothetical protein
MVDKRTTTVYSSSMELQFIFTPKIVIKSPFIVILSIFLSIALRNH